MKVLLLSLLVGEGLIKMNRSVEEVLTARGHRVRAARIYENDPQKEKFNGEGYYKAMKLIPHLLVLGQKFGWWFGSHLKGTRPVFLGSDIKHSRRAVLEFLEEEKPDFIFTPVNFVGLALEQLKKEGSLPCEYGLLSPDYHVPLCSQMCRSAAFLATADEGVTQMYRRYDLHNLETTGIPVGRAFTDLPPKEELRQKLGVPCGRNVLITNGGFGFGRNLDFVRALTRELTDCGIIFVNGRNAEQKEKIDAYLAESGVRNVVNLGFVDNMQEWMAVSDVMVGKCGGCTVSEAAALDLNFVAYDNRFFPEMDNLKYLKDRAATVAVRRPKQIVRVLARYDQDPASFEQMRARLSALNDGHGAERLADLIENRA